MGKGLPQTKVKIKQGQAVAEEKSDFKSEVMRK